MNEEGQPNFDLTDWDRECMAWHEAGHAVCAWALPEGTPVLKVSIVPGDDAFGLMKRAPHRHHNETERSFRSSIGVFLAGGISERLFLKRTTTSVGEDLRIACGIAHDMVCRFGMGRRTGWMCLSEDITKSEDFLQRVEADVREILEDAVHEVGEVLGAHADLTRSLALRLIAEGTVASPFLPA